MFDDDTLVRILRDLGDFNRELESDLNYATLNRILNDLCIQNKEGEKYETI